jgi:hypothetical protein
MGHAPARCLRRLSSLFMDVSHRVATLAKVTTSPNAVNREAGVALEGRAAEVGRIRFGSLGV